MQDYRNLIVWQKAHLLTLEIYSATSNFPAAEQFGLTNQLRRACVSIGSNIAEGCARGSDREFRRHLRIANGSASEVAYQLLLARDLTFLSEIRYDELFDLLHEVRKMLWSLCGKLKA